MKIKLLLVLSSLMSVLFPATGAVIDTLPDYSPCGYRSGGVKLPSAPVKIILTPGAAGDDTARIQSAIDKVGVMKLDKYGIRGAVLLKAGTYCVSGTLNMMKNGVTLRGEGQKNNGTIIFASGTKKRSLIMLGARSRKKIKLDKDRINITDKKLPINSITVNVSRPTDLKVGDDIIIYYEPTDKWVKKNGMDKMTVLSWRKTRQWKAKDFVREYDRRVVAINGKAVTLNAALPENYDQLYYKPAYIKKYSSDRRVQECGVENMRLISSYRKGYENSDEQHAWTAVEVANARNCWVKNISALHFGFAAVFLQKWSQNITVQDSACIDPVSLITGSRRYPFLVCGQLNLIQRCYARRGRHDFASNWKVCGMNVFLDCFSVKSFNDSGPHACWSTGTIYDNVRVKGGSINIQDRDCMGGGHGWAGANEVLWNCEAYSFICEKPPTANNYAIGCIGRKMKGHTKKREFGYWESLGTHVSPRSLYLKQLRKRLGSGAVNNITVPEQRTAFPMKYLQKHIVEPDTNNVNMLFNANLIVLKNNRRKYWRGNAYGGGAHKALMKPIEGPNGKPAALFVNEKASSIHVFQYMFLKDSYGTCEVEFDFKATAGAKVTVSLNARHELKDGKRIDSQGKLPVSITATGAWQKFKAAFKIPHGITGKLVLNIKARGKKLFMADAKVCELQK